MPLHNSAQYVPAHIQAATAAGMTLDEDILILSPDAPLKSVYTNTAGWNPAQTRCGTVTSTLLYPTQVPVPADFTTDPGYDGTTPNASSAVLLSDGVTIKQQQPLHVCGTGGTVTAQYVFPDNNIRSGDGIRGAHGGSGLSSMGGSLRVGELVPDGALTHALKINLNSPFLAYNNDGTRGYRWPAVAADSNAPSTYTGTSSALEMGALLALKPDFNVAALRTEPARILARALQSYGGYVADTTGWDVYGFETEWGTGGRVRDSFRSTWGWDFSVPKLSSCVDTSSECKWAKDMADVFTALNVVDNNTVNTIGGGANAQTGTSYRRAPQAPPFIPLAPTGTPANALDRSGMSVRQSSALGSGSTNNILDGNLASRWVSQAVQSNALMLQIDLGSVRDLTGLVIDAGRGSQKYLRSYSLYLSSDPNFWGTWTAGASGVSSTRLAISFAQTSARYITLQLGYDAPGQPWEIAELWPIGTGVSASGSRDPWLWPFAANSIWNTPIGSGANYVLPEHFQPGTGHNSDGEFHLKLNSADPLRQVYGVPLWTNRCADTSQPQTAPDGSPLRINLPDDFILDDVVTVGGYNTPNDVTSLLQADGSLIALEPFARCSVGGNAFGYVKNDTGNESLTGLGIYGAHYGSGLSGFGGSIRFGELTSTADLHHVLKLNVPGDYLYYDSSNPENRVGGVVLDGKGYRWPADRNDSGAPTNYKGSLSTKAAKMGALLAIPSSTNINTLGLKTTMALKLAKALQNYGTYIVDDSGAITPTFAQYSFSMSKEAEGEFYEKMGYSFSQDNSATGVARDWFDDFGKLISALAVVDNNTPGAVGGPGTRLVAQALPAFGATDTTVPSAPSSLSVTGRTVNSVSLSWTGSTDNVAVMRYDIFDGARKLLSTYGKTTATLTGLNPNTALNLSVKAVDTGLNLSIASNTVTTSSKDGYTEAFDLGTAPGWTLPSGVTVEYNHLRLNGFSSSKLTALYDTRSWSGPYVLSLNLWTDGQDNNGKTRLIFNSSASGYYAVEFGGGTSNTVTLHKNLGGTDSVLATFSGSYPIWNAGAPTVQLTYSSGSITVTGIKADASTTLFNGVLDGSLTSGKFGIEVLGMQSFTDNVVLTLN